MKKYLRLWISIAIILFGFTYSFLLFSLKKELTLTEWIVYGFTILALGITMLWFCIKSGNTKEYPMFDRPLSVIILSYCGIQVLGSIVGYVWKLPGEYRTLTIEAVFLLVFIITVVVLNAFMSTTRRIDDIDHKNVSDIRLLAASSKTIRNSLTEEDLIKKADRMAEALQYADPCSIEETRSLEERIGNNLSLLQEDIDSGDLNKAGIRMDNIVNMVNERADIIAALKK